MEKGLVSIIMPVFNAKEYIEDAILSVIKQDYSDLEIILIDDRSSDGSWEIAKSFNDDRIRYVVNEKNLGVSESRNIGMDKSSGEFIIFLDHDDIMPKGRIRRHVAYLSDNTDKVAVGGRIFNIDNENNYLSEFDIGECGDPEYIKARLLFQGVFIGGAVTYRTSVLKDNNIRFWANAYGLEDHILSVEVSKKGDIGVINNLVLWYRRHDRNTEKEIFKYHLAERVSKMAEICRYALDADGISISKEDSFLLINGISERRKRPLSNGELGEILMVFEKIEKLAREKKVRNADCISAVLKDYRIWFCDEN